MDNLSLPQVAAGQTQKEVTINEATAQLAGALSDFQSVDLSAGNVTISSGDFTSYAGFATTGNSVSRDLTVPAIKRARFDVTNGGSATLNVKRGSTTLTVAAGDTVSLRTDGTTNSLASMAPAAPGGTAEIDIGISISGKPVDTQKVIYIVNQNFTLPTSLTGSHAYIDTNPTSSFAIDIAKNGSSIGTITFNTSGVASFTFASGTSFTAGDKLKLTFPSPQDATGADIALNLKATQ